jgi:hypothetical protein
VVAEEVCANRCDGVGGVRGARAHVGAEVAGRTALRELAREGRGGGREAEENRVAGEEEMRRRRAHRLRPARALHRRRPGLPRARAWQSQRRARRSGAAARSHRRRWLLERGRRHAAGGAREYHRGQRRDAAAVARAAAEACIAHVTRRRGAANCRAASRRARRAASQAGGRAPGSLYMGFRVQPPPEAGLKDGSQPGRGLQVPS